MNFSNLENCYDFHGLTPFLNTGQQKRNIHFLLNHTNHENVHRRQKGLSKYFQGVYGSPTGKAFWANKIIMQEKLNCETTLFIGDAMSDHEAAKENGLIFVARINNDNKEIFEGVHVDYKVYDLFEFDMLLEKEN